MELRQLKQFVAVAELGSFRLAAERLHMAQPPLSVAIRKLEEELGHVMFVRTSRGTSLTVAGEAILRAARTCLHAAADIKEQAELASSGLSGTLKIGFSGSVAVRILPAIVRSFREQYPQIRLELREETNAGMLAQVESDALDAVFVRLPTTRPHDMLFRVVEDDRFCLAVPRRHSLVKQRSISLSALEGQPFIGYASSPVGGLHAAVARVLQRAGVAPRITQETVQVQTALGLVASGLGVAMVPAANTPYQRLLGAVFRPIADLPPDCGIGIALFYRRSNDSPVLARFVDVASAYAET